MPEVTRCPYRSICKCKGDELGRGEWEPSLGFKRIPEGVLCLDWNVTIPFEKIAKLKELDHEGRHIVSPIEAADKLDTVRRRWSRSPKRRKAQKKYEDTEKGQDTIDKYEDSEKFKLSLRKYYHSKKGQKAHQKRREKVKDFRKAEKWLKEHPGKTYEDYLKEIGKP